MKIFKYPLAVVDRQTVEMPKGATILCCQIQLDKPCLWAAVDPDAPLEPRTILVVGTGRDTAFGLATTEYIGTIQLNEGVFIFHVFELVE